MKIRTILIVFYLLTVLIVTAVLYVGYIFLTKPTEPKDPYVPRMMNKFRKQWGRRFGRLGKDVEIVYLSKVYFDKFGGRSRIYFMYMK